MTARYKNPPQHPYMKMGRGDSSSPIVFYFSIYLGNSEQVCNQGLGIWVPKIKMHKNEVEPWLWTQDLGPISVSKVDKSF